MENFPDFMTVFLQLHNEYRAIHSSPPLQIDDQLNEPAQEWADILADNRAIEYKSDPEYGENIFVTASRVGPKEIRPNDPLEYWYREGRYFKYGEEEVKGLEHVRQFTQLVWKDTTFIGIGVAVDDDERIYFVCIYYPPGNVEGGYVENVLPPPQIEEEMLPHEAEEIRTIELKPDVAKSMERLFSVPSEKLRVWSIWLSKIGEIADEWQRWLRAHIDLSIRLSEQLMAAQEALRLAMEEEIQEVEVSLESVVDAEVQLDADDTDLTVVEVSGEYDEEVIEERFDEEGEIEVVQEVDVVEEVVEVEVVETVEEVDQVALETDSEEGIEGEEEVAEDSEQWQSTWPLGSPWKHLGIEDPDDTPPFEQLPLPTSEEEMMQFVRKFTHQATIYRSYYKHWNETADRAIREVTSRSVLATYIVQGKDETGKVKQKPCPPPKVKKPCPPTKRKAKKLRGTTEKEKEQADESAESPPETQDEETAEAPAEEVPAEEEAPPPEDEAAASPPAEETTQPIEEEMTAASKLSQSLPVTVDDLVRDCARAAEPVPYIFYVKAEPDIEIAIEHDDEEVIAADTDRENIVGNFRRVFYNLTDKPCKGGKPWI